MPPPSSKISGIPVTSIINMKSVNVTSIVSIGGVSTSNIPGWPSGGGCETLSLGHSSFPPPTQACRNPQNDYQFDSTNSILYAIGELCGGTPAPNGFYSDGRTIFGWFDQILEVVGSCR
jgi:hypothetical protein